MKPRYDIIFHLSHNDLDGYGSQYMTHLIEVLSNNKTKIQYFNAGYEEVKEKINKVFEQVLQNKTKKILFMITDLSIDEEIAKKMNNFKRGNKNIDITYQVLDHHKTGEEIANKTEWYKYDISKCGSSLTAEYAINNLIDNEKLKKHLKFAGDFIQAHDIWEKDSKYFHAANYLSDIIFSLPFPDFMEEEKRIFFFNYIYIYLKTYQEDNLSVMDLEKRSVEILNNTLELLNIKNKEILRNEDIRSLHKLFYLQSEIYEDKYKNNFETFELDNLKFQFFYNENNTFFQYFSHYFLENNKDIDFVVNIKDSGKMSFRSVNENADVEKIAKIFDKEGGGHKHASGAKIKFQKEVHSYGELKKEIELIINRYTKEQEVNEKLKPLKSFDSSKSTNPVLFRKNS